MAIRINSSYPLFCWWQWITFSPLPSIFHSNTLGISKERAKWKRTGKKRGWEGTCGVVAAAPKRRGSKSTEQGILLSLFFLPLPSSSLFLGPFSSRATSWQCARYFWKDNYICVPGRDRPAVSREESGVEAQETEGPHIHKHWQLLK